jgi:hypothetical protein
MTGTVGQSVGLQLTASDPGGLALSYSVIGLPPGLVSAYGGIIYGIPTTAGVFNVTVTVTNTLALSASQTFTWTILSQPGAAAFQVVVARVERAALRVPVAVERSVAFRAAAAVEQAAEAESAAARQAAAVAARRFKFQLSQLRI